MQTSDSSEWWAGIGGEPIGPLSAADLRARWEAGEITATTLVWRDGFGEWKPASEVPELAAMRPSASSAAAGWKPSAGSALAALAGAELAALQRPAHGPSGNPKLDRFTGASSGGGEESAAAAPITPRPAATAPRALRPERPVDASPAREREPSARWSVATSAAGTFAMGAAVAVALFIAFRGDRGADPSSRPATRAASSVPTPVAAAPVAEPPANTAAAAPVARAETPAPAPSTGNGEMKAAAAIRASDPPAEKPTAAATDARAAQREETAARATTRAASRPQRSAAATQAERPARAARAPAEPRRAVTAAPAAPKRSADPLDTPAPAVAPPPQQRAAVSDPLASLVTDDDLDRELGGGANRLARTTSAREVSPSAASSSSGAPSSATPGAARTQPGSGSSAVYVPPAPGGDLPDGVTPAQINDAVKARLASLRSCIDEQRASDPATKGVLKLRWVIGGDGSVKDVSNLSPEFEGKPISRCIGGVVQEIQFPASRTSGQEVVFPFKF